MTGESGWFTTSDHVELRTRIWTIDDPRYEVLIVHGLGEHCGRWDHVGDHFNRHGASAYSYDLRGHGESGGDRVHVEDFAELYRDISEMAEATAAASGRPWVLYGHSLGGLQTAGYLIDGYEPAPNLAVISAPPMQATRSVDAVLSKAARLLNRLNPGFRVDNSIKGDQLSRDPDVGEQYFDDPLVQSKATARFGHSVYSEMQRLEDGHGTITTPTLVFHGAEDTLVEPKASAVLASSPGVQRKVYPNLRHETHNEPESAQVLGDVTDWIDAKLAGTA